MLIMPKTGALKQMLRPFLSCLASTLQTLAVRLGEVGPHTHTAGHGSGYASLSAAVGVSPAKAGQKSSLPNASLASLIA